jgi:hypothetical protein
MIENVRYENGERTAVAAKIDGETWTGIRLDGVSGLQRRVQEWIDAGNTPADYVPPVVRRLVPRALIVDRLHAAGKLAAARAALDQASLYDRERWNARREVYADDPTATALLQAIGADPAVILAP